MDKTNDIMKEAEEAAQQTTALVRAEVIAAMRRLKAPVLAIADAGGDGMSISKAIDTMTEIVADLARKSCIIGFHEGARNANKAWNTAIDNAESRLNQMKQRSENGLQEQR